MLQYLETMVFFPLSQLISGHDSFQKDSESVPESYHGHNF